MPQNKASNRAGLARIFGLVAVLTVLSKIVGLVRDQVVAAAFGTGLIADAYNLAYLLTGNILILFGGLGGPFHSATVSVLTGRKNDPAMGKLVGQMLLYTFLALGVLALAVFIAAPHLVPLIFPAADHTFDYRQQLWHETSFHLRIMTPLIVIAGIIGIIYGILNIYGRVVWPSLSPSIASIAIIVAVGFKGSVGSLCLSLGTLIGAIGQLAAQIPELTVAKMKVAAAARPQPGFREYNKVLWPAMISTSIGQLIVFIDAQFASQLESGAWTAIVYANRLLQLPLGVLLTAMLVPILPRFTEQATANEHESVKSEFQRALSFLWFLAMPIGALLIALPQPIVMVLFQRGAFDEQSTNLVTIALLFQVPSMVFYLGRDLITRVYYAYQDSTTPFQVALLAIAVKFALNWLLVLQLKMGLAGISLATTLITVFNLTLLASLLRKKIGPMGHVKLLQPILLMLVACAACGATARVSHAWLMAHPIFPSNFAQHGVPAFVQQVFSNNFAQNLFSLTLASILGLAVYAAVSVAFRLKETAMLQERINARLSR